MWSVFSSEPPPPPPDTKQAKPASLAARQARARLRERAESLSTQVNKPVTRSMSRMEQAQAQAAAPAPAAKHMPNDEASTHHIEDVRSTTSTTRTTSSTARASSARYMTARGGASARFRAMTERDEEAEKAARDAEKSARQSARRSARRASARYHEKPLTTRIPSLPRWRLWPSDIVPDNRDVTKLWKDADRVHKLGQDAIAAFISAGAAHKEKRENGEIQVQIVEGLPAEPVKQDPSIGYGSKRACIALPPCTRLPCTLHSLLTTHN